MAPELQIKRSQYMSMQYVYSMFGQVSKLSMIFAWAVVSKQVLELLSSTARVSNMWYLVGPHQSEASHDLVSSRYLTRATEGGAQTATEHASRPPGIDPRASNTGAARERMGSVLLDMRRVLRPCHNGQGDQGGDTNQYL